jgi:acyl-CoA dehydrogenase
VTDKVYKLDVLWPRDTYRPLTDEQRKVIGPMKQAVREAAL